MLVSPVIAAIKQVYVYRNAQSVLICDVLLSADDVGDFTLRTSDPAFLGVIQTAVILGVKVRLEFDNANPPNMTSVLLKA